MDRIDNYEAFHEALGENSGFLGFIEVLAYPFVLERSQLYRIEQCGSNIALTVNYLRTWLVATVEIEEPDIQLEMKAMRHNAVNIDRLQKDVEKILKDIEILKDKVRQNGNHN